jgi:hypothetical protein
MSRLINPFSDVIDIVRQPKENSMIEQKMIDGVLQREAGQERWSENVIVVDADYIDRVAFNLIVNFERMLGRKIPAADMPRWIDCVALDGGISPTENAEWNVTVVLIHEKGSQGLENFIPASYGELHGTAFKDHLGEFVFSSVPVENLTTKDDLLLDVVQAAMGAKEVKRLMVVPNAEDGDCYDRLRQTLRHADDDKRITLFAMQPMAGGRFQQEILGYSLMQALGISAAELDSKM